jgi:hypothetical protein
VIRLLPLSTLSLSSQHPPEIHHGGLGDVVNEESSILHPKILHVRGKQLGYESPRHTNLPNLDQLDSSTTSTTPSLITNQTDTHSQITLADTLSQAHKHTGSQTHSLTSLSSTPKRLKGGTTTHSLSSKHQPVASCRLEATPIAHKQAHLHITHTVDPASQSDTSPIRQPSLLRHTRSSLCCPNQAQLE